MPFISQECKMLSSPLLRQKECKITHQCLWCGTLHHDSFKHAYTNYFTASFCDQNCSNAFNAHLLTLSHVGDSGQCGTTSGGGMRCHSLVGDSGQTGGGQVIGGRQVHSLVGDGGISGGGQAIGGRQVHSLVGDGGQCGSGSGGGHRSHILTMSHDHGSHTSPRPTRRRSASRTRRPRTHSRSHTHHANRGGGYGRGGYHGGYRRSFWSYGNNRFYPFGFGMYWFRSYPWLPFYYSLYAYQYWPVAWTPLYIPAPQYYNGEAYDEGFISQPRSYVRNPDIEPNTPLPDVPLPALDVSMNDLRDLSAKKQENLSAQEEGRIRALFDRIDQQYRELVARLKSEGLYQKWAAFRIVPDLDQGKFIWIRDDTQGYQNTMLREENVFLHHCYGDGARETGHLITHDGDVYEYHRCENCASLSYAELATRVSNIPSHQETLLSSIKAHLHAKTNNAIEKSSLNEAVTSYETLFAYYSTGKRFTIYSSHHQSPCQFNTEIENLYNQLEW